MQTGTDTVVMDERAVRRALARMAREIVEANAGTQGLVLVGIHRRGVELSEQLVDEIESGEGQTVPRGTLDITLYRDDLSVIGPRPLIGESHIPDIDDKAVVIVDDVSHTGRTARAAMDHLADYGRPARIYLCVLVDRGGRELPIQPDFVGRHFEVSDAEDVAVHVANLDGRLSVELHKIESV